jgi:hypothetical protein
MMKKKLMDMVRTTLTDTSPQDIKHENRVDQESNLKMANAKKKWLIDYQAEREKKREFIRQNVLAQGLDLSKLTEKMQKTKDTIIPSVDDHTLDDLRNMVEELQLEEKAKQEDGEEQIDSSKKNGGSGEYQDNQSSLALFDKLQQKEDAELDDSVSSVMSSNSFRSVSTRKLKLTVLNQKAYSQIYVAE